jgi:hypothetical protein
MQYRYLKNLREQVKLYKSSDLSKLKKTKPKFKTKSQFRDWCADSKTDHCFYTMVEGDSPSARVTGDNPPNAIDGVVVDYDAPTDWSIIDKLLKAQCKQYMPMWRSETYSGYVRLVFPFESKMPISPDMFPAFMKQMSIQLSLERILPGFDASSLKATQYFELGTNWVKIGDPLPKSFYRTALFKASMDKPPQTSEVSIPIDVIATEVEARFPNRWVNAFEVGARGPLFWINDGIDRDGCQIVDDGIVCYSDRAGKGFVTWRELFGSAFLKQYETQKMGGILDEYWFNGKMFFKLIYGKAHATPKDQVILELRKAGFSPRAKKGQPLSEVENAILTISNENRIDEIAPVIFSKDRIVEYNSQRILNSGNINPVEPADNGDPANWPFIHKFLHQLFANAAGKPDTIEYFFAWMKRFLISVLNKEPMQGQALLLVGGVGKGKSLLSNRIIAGMVGGFADASDYLSGQSNFNKDLAGKAAWVIDDTTSAASFQDQRRATELIKKTVANPRIDYHAKYVDAIAVPWAGRVVFSVNMDANSLSVIPALDSSNRDKLMALRIGDKATNKFPPNVKVESVIKDELPYFAKWLLDWDVPKKVEGLSRFGVVSYIDQSIASAAYDNSSRSSIAELVEFFVKRSRMYSSDKTWWGTLTEFQVAVHEFNGGRAVGMSSSLEFMRRGMQIMEESAQNNKKLRSIKSVGHGGGKIWEIDLDEKYDIHKGQVSNKVNTP